MGARGQGLGRHGDGGLLDPLLGLAGTPHLPTLRGGRTGMEFAEPVNAESLDYETLVNRLSLKKAEEEHFSHRRHIYGYTGQTFGRLVATFTSGVAIGLTGAALQLAVDVSVRQRNSLLGRLFLDSSSGGGGLAPAFAAMLAISLAAVLLTTLLVHYWAPRAAGGGVALVMAFLNGNAIQDLLSGKVYVTKMLGTAASRLAGLALGIEGPMIHLGAAVASLVCHGEHVAYRALNWHRKGCGNAKSGLDARARAAGLAPRPISEFLFSNLDHRELVSAGAAAGLASAFGAPIGGVLFALEEATSVWSRKLAWRCFLCASVACFTMAQLHPRMQSGMLSFRGIYPLTNLQWLMQGPLVVFASACGGLLGCIFNLLKSWARTWRRRHPGIRWRLAEGAVVTLATVAAVTGLPAVAGTCLQLPDQWEANEVMRYRCQAGQYNDLATALLGNGVWVIRSLLSMGSDTEPVNRLCSLALPCYYSATSLAVLVVTYLILFFLASNLIVPGGLFMPCILIGSAFGVLLGLLLSEVLPPSWDIQPGVYAVVAATAMLGATFRSSISLVVIVVEGTRGIELMFGVIMAVIVSNYVAHFLHPDGLYEAELDRQQGNCFYLRQEPPHALRSETAETIMASPVVGLRAIESVATVLRVLYGTSHNGFPVLSSKATTVAAATATAAAAQMAFGGGHWQAAAAVQGDSGVGGGSGSGGCSKGWLQGFVLRSQLLVLLRHGAFCDEQGQYLCPHAQRDAATFDAALDYEMQAAAQASNSAYRSTAAAALPAPGPSSSMGRLGPATSMGVAGFGFPTLDPSRGAASVPEVAVLDAAAEAAVAAVVGGGAAYLNLTSFMNLAPMTVRPHTPGDRLHHLFLSLSLRHLCVTDPLCRCVGIITRKDLDHAAGVGWWRATEIAPTPHQSPRGGQSQLGGGSPGSWAASMDNFVRAMAVPPRRLVQALQQRFSPRASPGGASPVLQQQERSGARSGGGSLRSSSPRAEDPGSSAAMPLLDGSPGRAGTAEQPPRGSFSFGQGISGGSGAGGSSGGSRGGLLHSLSAPSHMYTNLQQSAWSFGDAASPGATVAGSSSNSSSRAPAPAVDLERQ